MILQYAFQVIDFSPVIGIFSNFFTPFLSHNYMISRQLQTNRGLFYHLYEHENGFWDGKRRSIEAQNEKAPSTEQGD
jgi:hypothetical protein